MNEITWKTAAFRLGEELTDYGPAEYYKYSPEEFISWALKQIHRIKHED